MAYTAGFTAVTGATYTAAQYNTNVRDNLAAIWVGTTAGDLDYYTSATTKNRLGIGSDGQVLSVVGGVPAWAAGLPAGAIVDYGGASAPSGWLLCDGSAVNRTTYAALFTAIGTTFGAGNGSTTFNVPDFRGRTGIGAGQGSGLTNRVRGTALGEESHALTSAENGPHTHSYTATLVDPADGAADGSQRNIPLNNTGYTSGSSGSGTAHNTMQPSLVVNKLIKT